MLIIIKRVIGKRRSDDWRREVNREISHFLSNLNKFTDTLKSFLQQQDFLGQIVCTVHCFENDETPQVLSTITSFR